MYICVCRAVNERGLRELVRDGAANLRAVNQCTGLGGVCGRCVPYARDVIADERGHAAAPLAGVGSSVKRVTPRVPASEPAPA